MLTEYKNEVCVDFSKQENGSLMLEALKRIDEIKDAHYPLVIGGERFDSEQIIKSVNPSRYDEIVGTAASATIEQAEKAVQCALNAFSNWKNICARERAGYLLKAASLFILSPTSFEPVKLMNRIRGCFTR